jgi:hypothetical protein
MSGSSRFSPDQRARAVRAFGNDLPGAPPISAAMRSTGRCRPLRTSPSAEAERPSTASTTSASSSRTRALQEGDEG